MHAHPKVLRKSELNGPARARLVWRGCTNSGDATLTTDLDGYAVHSGPVLCQKPPDSRFQQDCGAADGSSSTIKFICVAARSTYLGKYDDNRITGSILACARVRRAHQLAQLPACASNCACLGLGRRCPRPRGLPGSGRPSDRGADFADRARDRKAGRAPIRRRRRSYIRCFTQFRGRSRRSCRSWPNHSRARYRCPPSRT